MTIQGTWTTPPAAGSVYSIRAATAGSGIIVSSNNTAVLTSYMTWTINGPSVTGVRAFQAQAIENGTLTGATNTPSTLTDSSKTWATNQYAGYVAVTTTGTAVGQARTIVSNTATTLTLASNWTSIPAATTGYIIIPFVYWTQATNVYFPDSGAVTGNTSYTNGITFGTLATTPASAN